MFSKHAPRQKGVVDTVLSALRVSHISRRSDLYRHVIVTNWLFYFDYFNDSETDSNTISESSFATPQVQC